MFCAAWVASAERMPPAQKKTNFLPAREEGLVIGAFGVDPELDHAAGHVARAGDGTLAPQLPDVANVDELDARVVHQRDGVLGRKRLDLGLGVRHQLLDSLGNHAPLPTSRPAAR